MDKKVKYLLTGHGTSRRRKHIPDSTLPNGSVILWTKRFKDETGIWHVWVRCGHCGRERLVQTQTPHRKDYTGLCEKCANIVKRKHTTDETLPSGSVIFWSRCFKDEKGVRRVWVRCGDCGKERTVRVSQPYKKDFAGRCPSCTQMAKRKHVKSGAETLPSGSIIYWDDEICKNGERTVLVRCGGPRCGGYTRYIHLQNILADNFTGFCIKCATAKTGAARSGPESSSWKGGKRITPHGYVLVWLPPDHPLYSMTDSSGCVLEHRLVKAQQIGRPLQPDEIVHHENGNRQNNHPSNLRLYVKDPNYTGWTPHLGHRPVEPKPSPNRLVALVYKVLWYLSRLSIFIVVER